MSSSLAQSHLPGLGPIKMAVRGPRLHLAPRTILLRWNRLLLNSSVLCDTNAFTCAVIICVCIFAFVYLQMCLSCCTHCVLGYRTPILIQPNCVFRKNISFGFENSYFSLEFLVKLLVLFTCFFVFCLFGFFPNIANFVLFK